MSDKKHVNVEQETGVYYAPWEKTADRILTPFERFIHRETTSSLILVAATVLALVLANSVFYEAYYHFTHMDLGFSLGGLTMSKPLHHWVNDGLMTLFFFVVGLELKREILVGELANPRKAALPIMAAVGGMAVPALVYYAFNPSGAMSNGWAVPMATDIAFAIGLMVMLGDRVPRSLMAFLVALAIADDLGAVVVIALFYTENLHLPALGMAGVFTAVLVFFNFIGVRWSVPYFLIAVLLWVAMLYSGIHPTLAGIIGAFCVPARPKYDPKYFRAQSTDILEKFDISNKSGGSVMTNVTMKSLIQSMEDLVLSVMTPLQRLEHIWHMPVAFFVIPVFAFFNAGVVFNFGNVFEGTNANVFMGIMFGLIFGKFVGISGACWIAIKLGFAQLPSNTSFRQIIGAAFLAGIGFTMSVFIAQLAFVDNPKLLEVAKMAILLASLMSGAFGFLWLWFAGKNKRYECSSNLAS
jgi:NhaA family Na+:H+ antiporter|tara:strand:+ start:184522 stop:185925 length:1404 start_codon:yes stop_codon:yes gene_type:complete